MPTRFAGLQPRVYEAHTPIWLPEAGRREWVVLCYDPLAEPAVLEVEGRNCLLWRAFHRPPWTPEQHRSFPPAFQAAVRALLVAAAASSKRLEVAAAAATASGGGGANPAAGAGLGSLPPELLQHIAALAAYPLSAWMG